jgi:hypothetical protein
MNEEKNALENLLDCMTNILSSDDPELDQLQEIVNYIKQNRHDLDNLSINNIAGLQDALDGKVDNSQVLTPVPENAKFTDTWRPISDSVSSTDSTVSASSQAVKTAYDKATQALSQAGTVPTGLGAVGTYIYAQSSSQKWPGATTSGSSLLYSGHSKQGGASVFTNTKPSGTWRCMGFAGSGSHSTLFVRIA